MKISIITVTFNSEKTLADTIESVLNQTYPNIEYLIIDGNSKDRTMDVVRRYLQANDERIKVLSEPDKGIYDAMNKGIRMASGDVIGILNSDDFFTSHSIIESVAHAFEQDSSLDMVYGDVHFVNDDNPDKCVRYYSSKIFRPWMFRFGMMPAHPSCYIRRECFEKYGLYSLDYKIASDFELLLRFIYKAKIKIKYLPLDFVTMRMGGVSTAGLKSYLFHNREDVLACKRNGVWTCLPLFMLKYLYKVFELKPFK